MPELDLATFWAGMIAFAVLAYVILDGFDLGIGILYPLIRKPEHRDLAMNTIAPFWDGNETWLVMGGGGLFAVFPLAYAVVMPALYIPIIFMLLGLVFRGVAFEFIHRSRNNRHLWEKGFAYGSLTAAISQGIALGALVQGIAVENRAYAGGWWDWLTPFTLLTALALVVGYALLGSCWLVLKTEGQVQKFARHGARVLSLATVALIGAVSLATPFMNPAYFERWFTMPAALYSSIVPLLLFGCIYSLFRGLRWGVDLQPFLSALGIFIFSAAGLGVSLFPYMIPPSITIAEAAAPDDSLLFLLVGAVVLVP
ncbi:MAG: cytochrome d ubiquinol oxidase subunit II, partial [Rhodospirillaceae bacterium]